MKKIKFDLLLQPINETSPTGLNVRETDSLKTLYYELKDTRQSARLLEKKFLLKESTHDGLLEWNTVIELAFDILVNHSKDLEILAWLMEGVLRVYHFQGLADIFNIVSLLLELYWDNLFPIENNSDNDYKLAAIIGLNGVDAPGTLIQPIKSVPITQTTLSECSFALWQYQQALEIDKLHDTIKRNQRQQQLGYSVSDIQSAANNSTAEFYSTLIHSLQQCLTNFDKLNTVFATKCGTNAPPSSYIQNALCDVLDHVKFLSNNRTHKSKKCDDHSKKNVIKMIDKQPFSTNILTAKLSNRYEALHVIQQAADYFIDNEPHSPIPYLLARTIHWSTMKLPELLEEIIHETETRKNINKLIGIRE